MRLIASLIVLLLVACSPEPPDLEPTVEAVVRATIDAAYPATPTHTPVPTPTSTPAPIPTPTVTPTPAATPTPTVTPTPTPRPEPTCVPNLGQLSPEQEQQIARLTWSRFSVEALERLGERSPAAFRAWLERFGDDAPPLGLTDAFTLLAVCNEAAAVWVAGMPFLDDASLGHEFAFSDELIVEALARVGRADPDGLPTVLARPELQGGITDASTALVMLLALEYEDAAAAAAIRALPWVADGITNPMDAETYGMRDINYYEGWPYKATEDETRHVVRLVWKARRAPRSFQAFMDIPWVRDGYGPHEFNLIDVLGRLAYGDDESTARILAMPFLETPGGDDGEIAGLLSNIEHEGALPEVLSSPRLERGIGDDDLALVALAYVEVQDRDAGAALDGLAWLQDGVLPSERDGVLLLTDAVASPQFFRALLAKDWVRDGLTRAESQVIRYLTYVARPHGGESTEPTVLRILDMPFLQGEITSLDALAIGTLWLLPYRGGDISVQSVLSRPELHGGITEEWASRLAVVYLTHSDPGLTEIVLDPRLTPVGKRVVTLPNTGAVTLHVIEPGRTGPSGGAGAREPMDLLERAVRAHEEFMGAALPVRDVVLVIGESTRSGFGYRGNGLLTAPSGDDVSAITGGATGIWRFITPRWLDSPSSWMVRGATEFLARISYRTFFGTPLPEAVSSCGLANNISELLALEELDPDVVYRSACNSILGRGLFLELYDRLGDAAFRQGFRDLYLAGTEEEGVEDAREACTGDHAALCYFKSAFLSGMTPEQSAVAEEIIDRRYYGAR